MTIQQRLALSFLTILLLFGVNLGIYFWSNEKRGATVESLQRAISRQILLASIKQDLNDLQKAVALLSQIGAEGIPSGAGPDTIQQFNRQVESIGKRIRELRELSDPEMKAQVESFGEVYQKLSFSWRIFYDNFGVNHTRAITELAINADPLSQREAQKLVMLQNEEKKRVEAANVQFYEVARLTDRMTILIFSFSTLVSIGIAFWVSRYLARGCSELKRGAKLIGEGNLGHNISIQSNDELGDLAKAFNQMTTNLRSARTDLMEVNKKLEDRHEDLEKQRQVSESLLLNILPIKVAQELQKKGSVEPSYYEDVTIIFTDFVGFTLSTEKVAAEDLVHALNDHFTSFDQIIGRYGLEKLKTIGDSYMCVGGLPERNPSHPVDAVMAAFEILKAVNKRKGLPCLVNWNVRIGIHTGSVIAGVVGIKKFAFDIWGESVNLASRMESSGAPNRINLSHATYMRVKDFFEFEHRGKVRTKDNREFNMHFVKGILPTLVGESTQNPPHAFLRRYRVYFQKAPPAFPDFLLESPSLLDDTFLS